MISSVSDVLEHLRDNKEFQDIIRSSLNTDNSAYKKKECLNKKKVIHNTPYSTQNTGKDTPSATSQNTLYEGIPDVMDNSSCHLRELKLMVTMINDFDVTEFWGQLFTKRTIDFNTKLEKELCKLCPNLPPVTTVERYNIYAAQWDEVWYRCVTTGRPKDGSVSIFFTDYGNRARRKVSALRLLPRHLLDIPFLAFPFKMPGLQQVKGEEFESIRQINIKRPISVFVSTPISHKTETPALLVRPTSELEQECPGILTYNSFLLHKKLVEVVPEPRPPVIPHAFFITGLEKQYTKALADIQSLKSEIKRLKSNKSTKAGNTSVLEQGAASNSVQSDIPAPTQPDAVLSFDEKLDDTLPLLQAFYINSANKESKIDILKTKVKHVKELELPDLLIQEEFISGLEDSLKSVCNEIRHTDQQEIENFIKSRDELLVQAEEALKQYSRDYESSNVDVVYTELLDIQSTNTFSCHTPKPNSSHVNKPNFNISYLHNLQSDLSYKSDEASIVSEKSDHDTLRSETLEKGTHNTETFEDTIYESEILADNKSGTLPVKNTSLISVNTGTRGSGVSKPGVSMCKSELEERCLKEIGLFEENVTSLSQMLTELRHSQTSLSGAVNLTHKLDNMSVKLKEYCEVLDKENRDMGPAILEITSLLHSKCEHRITKIRHYQEVQQKYSVTLSKVEQCLYHKPDLSTLSTIRKEIKALKRKVKLALVDMECVSDSEEQTNQKCELLDLMASLHKLYMEEDSIIMNVRELAESYLPELYLQHAALQELTTHHRLIKTGWELAQFVPPNSKTYFNSDKRLVSEGIFNHKKCYLVEYLLTEKEIARQIEDTLPGCFAVILDRKRLRAYGCTYIM